MIQVEGRIIRGVEGPVHLPKDKRNGIGSDPAKSPAVFGRCHQSERPVCVGNVPNWLENCLLTRDPGRFAPKNAPVARAGGLCRQYLLRWLILAAARIEIPITTVQDRGGLIKEVLLEVSERDGSRLAPPHSPPHFLETIE